MRTLIIFLILWQSSMTLSAQEPDVAIEPTSTSTVAAMPVTEEPKIDLFKNPNGRSFHLTYKNILNLNSIKIKVLDAEGQTVMRRTFKAQAEDIVGTIQMGGNASGVYFVEISGIAENSTAFMKTRRIVVD